MEIVDSGGEINNNNKNNDIVERVWGYSTGRLNFDFVVTRPYIIESSSW